MGSVVATALSLEFHGGESIKKKNSPILEREVRYKLSKFGLWKFPPRVEYANSQELAIWRFPHFRSCRNFVIVSTTEIPSA